MVLTAMIGTKIFCFPSQIEMAFAMALTALLYTLKILFFKIFFYVTLLILYGQFFPNSWGL